MTFLHPRNRQSGKQRSQNAKLDHETDARDDGLPYRPREEVEAEIDVVQLFQRAKLGRDRAREVAEVEVGDLGRTIESIREQSGPLERRGKGSMQRVASIHSTAGGTTSTHVLITAPHATPQQAQAGNDQTLRTHLQLLAAGERRGRAREVVVGNVELRQLLQVAQRRLSV
jgi:hypothetical protein